MTSVAALIQEVHAAGGQLHQRGERLTVRAARPLDERLVADLRARKADVLAFLAAERQSGVPPEWRKGVTRLTAMAPLPGFAPRRWATLVTDAQSFPDEWSGQAVAAEPVRVQRSRVTAMNGSDQHLVRMNLHRQQVPQRLGSGRLKVAHLVDLGGLSWQASGT